MEYIAIYIVYAVVQALYGVRLMIQQRKADSENIMWLFIAYTLVAPVLTILFVFEIICHVVKKIVMYKL
jgi:hypothetical protein